MLEAEGEGISLTWGEIVAARVEAEAVTVPQALLAGMGLCVVALGR